jgi:ElaB/YqjD/DUF883 family membrane-anchored ribosome-binding protein
MLTEAVKATIKDAAKKLTGYRKRDFMAKVTEDYFNSSARKAETVLEWKRSGVQTGLHERRTGIICVDNYQARGRHKSEEILPNLEADIRSLVDAIFENVHQANKDSDQNIKSLRLSIDSKAKVKIGNLSRNGKSRTMEAKKADDHDTAWSTLQCLPLSNPDVLWECGSLAGQTMHVCC